MLQAILFQWKRIPFNTDNPIIEVQTPLECLKHFKRYG